MSISFHIISFPDGEVVQKKQFHFSKDTISIGRNHECDIFLSDTSETISRKQLVVNRNHEGRYSVVNMGKNETLVDNQILPFAKSVRLRDGGVLKICGYELLISFAEVRDDVKDEVKGNDMTQPNRAPFLVETNIHDAYPFFPDQPVNHGDDHETASQLEVQKESVDDFDDIFAEPLPLDNTSIKTEDKFETIAKMEQSMENQALESSFSPKETSSSLSQAEVHKLPIVNGSYDYLPADSGKHQKQLQILDLIDDIENAFNVFMEDIDPSNLEKEYKAMFDISLLKHPNYWKIHKAHFNSKVSRHEYWAQFLSILLGNASKK